MYVRSFAMQTDWIHQVGRKDKTDKLGLSCEENGVKRGGIGQRAKWGRVKLQGQIHLFLRGRDFPVILPPAPFTQSWSWGGGAWTPKTDSTQAHFYPFQLLPFSTFTHLQRLPMPLSSPSPLNCAAAVQLVLGLGWDSFGNWFQLPTNLFPP